MKSFYLREEKTPVRDLMNDGMFLDEPILLFSWAMIDKNKYIVISKKIFRKQIGDTVTVMSGREFEKFFKRLNIEAK